MSVGSGIPDVGPSWWQSAEATSSSGGLGRGGHSGPGNHGPCLVCMGRWRDPWVLLAVGWWWSVSRGGGMQERGGPGCQGWGMGAPGLPGSLLLRCSR